MSDGIVNQERPGDHNNNEGLKRQFFGPSACQDDGRHQSKHHLESGEERRGNGLATEAGVPRERDEENVVKRIPDVASKRRITEDQPETNHVPHDAADHKSCQRLHEHAQAVLAPDQSRLAYAHSWGLQVDERGGKKHKSCA